MTENTPFIDRPQTVRQGEELDSSRLERYLAAELPELTGPLAIEQFPSGHSNLTYLLRFGEHGLVLRRPPFGAKIKTAHDMHREFRILSALQGVYPKAPRPLVYCGDEAVLGAPFYLMQRMRGVILRGARPPKGLALPPETMQVLSSALIDTLAELHAVDLSATALSDLGHPEGYVARQVRGWTERYFRAKTDEIPDLERAAAWLATQMPVESGAALIHNDYKYDNLVLAPEALTRIIALLDWEMATVGDPLMDLGTALGYWIDADDPAPLRALPLGPTLLPGNLNRAQLVARYAQLTGRDVSGILFYYVYGLFKIAVIAQQIYHRYKQGLTQDQRFAMLIFGVQIIGQQTVRALDRGRIDGLG